MAHISIVISAANKENMTKKVYKILSDFSTIFLENNIFIDLEYDHLGLSCDNPFIDFGMIVREAINSGVKEEDLQYVFNWLRKTKLDIKSYCENESNYDFAPNNKARLLRMLCDNKLSKGDIEKLKDLLTIINNYNHDSYVWENIIINGKRYMALCDNYDAIDTLEFIWLIKIKPDGNIGKEIKIDKIIDEGTNIIRLNDFIYVETGQEVTDSKVEIYTYNLVQYNVFNSKGKYIPTLWTYVDKETQNRKLGIMYLEEFNATPWMLYNAHGVAIGDETISYELNYDYDDED